MPNKDSVTEIFIIAIVFAWPVMSIIFYLFIFVKAFVRSFNRIDTTQQSPLSSPEMELKNEQQDNELKNNFSLERINEWQSIEGSNNLVANTVKKGNKDLLMVFMLEQNEICIQYRNSTKLYIEMLEDAGIPLNKTKPDMQSQGIKLPIPYSNASEVAPYFAQD